MMVLPLADRRRVLQTDGIKWCLAPLGLRGNSHQRNNDGKLEEVTSRRKPMINIDFG